MIGHFEIHEVDGEFNVVVRDDTTDAVFTLDEVEAVTTASSDTVIYHPSTNGGMVCYDEI